MNTQYDSANVPFTAGEELAVNRIAKLSTAGVVILADAGEASIGVTRSPAASGKGVSVKQWNANGTFLVEAAKTFAAGVDLYVAADGKVSDTAVGKSIGKSNEACTVAGQSIEIVPAVAPQAAAVASLTDDSTGASGGDTIGAISDVPTAANGIATNAAKINELIASLEAAGVIIVTA